MAFSLRKKKSQFLILNGLTMKSLGLIDLDNWINPKKNILKSNSLISFGRLT